MYMQRLATPLVNFHLTSQVYQTLSERMQFAILNISTITCNVCSAISTQFNYLQIKILRIVSRNVSSQFPNVQHSSAEF